MKRYIAYLDVLGVKNSSETQNYEYYLRLITDFQNELMRVAEKIEEGRVHFFSDCAFIESKNLESLINSLQTLRDLLFDSDPDNGPTFIRGAVTYGILGAINGSENQEFIDDYYNDEDISKRYRYLKKSLINPSVQGTLFLSKDTARLVELESKLKGAAFNIDNIIINDIDKNKLVDSGYLTSFSVDNFRTFKDIAYEPEEITESFIDVLLKTFYRSNIYDINYGRYYLTVLISCINSINLSKLDIDENSSEYLNAPPLFYKVLNLRTEYRELYDRTQGLEFVYFTLINKVYSDLGRNSETTRTFLKQIFINKKYLGKYSNKISSVPTSVLSLENKNLMIRDFIANIEN